MMPRDWELEDEFEEKQEPPEGMNDHDPELEERRDRRRLDRNPEDADDPEQEALGKME
jgi:hypothetical protein